MLHTQFPAPEPSGSEEDLLIFFMHFMGPFWTQEPPFEQNQEMLYTKFQAPKPSGSEVEDFLIFSMYFY